METLKTGKAFKTILICMFFCRFYRFPATLLSVAATLRASATADN